jgi:hypothetical protein
VHENRLGLVVGVMAHGDFVRTHLPGHPRQECVAHAPGRLLEGQFVCVGQRRYVLPLDGDWQVPFGGNRCHEVGVGVGLCPPRAVVQVGHVEPQAVLLAQAQQDVEQAERIRPAGDADDYHLPLLAGGDEQAVCLDCAPDLFQDASQDSVTL